jgi:hypothetical protein
MLNDEKLKYDLISVADIDVKAPVVLISLGEFKKQYPDGEKYPELPDDIMGVIGNSCEVEGQSLNNKVTFHFLIRNGYGIYIDK